MGRTPQNAPWRRTIFWPRLLGSAHSSDQNRYWDDEDAVGVPSRRRRRQVEMIVPEISTRRAPRGWSPAERRLWRAFQDGQALDLRTGLPAEDDPAAAPSWPPERRIRAQVIAALLLCGPAAATGRVRSMRLTGAWVTGRLDLCGAVIDCGLDLTECSFEAGINLTLASADSVGLNGWRRRAAVANGRACSFRGFPSVRACSRARHRKSVSGSGPCVRPRTPDARLWQETYALL